MKVVETYKVMQKAWVEENDVKVGDRVKILRANKFNELGSDTYDHTERELGRRGRFATIDEICPSRINVRISSSNHYILPFFVLEIVEKVAKEPEQMITVNGKEYSESTLAKAMQEYTK